MALADHPKVIGIGETGLDYFYETAPKDVQQASFRAHIRAARIADVPLCIHARDADTDIATILREEREEGGHYDFLLHCFSSGRGLAEAAMAMGGYFSFSGILTFPKSSENRSIARDIPADRLLVETDAPYLAPVPYRGKRNEPSYVAKTAAVLAEVRGLAPAALADLTTANFRRLFRRAEPPDACDDSWLRRLRRRAASRRRGWTRRLGRLRPGGGTQPAHPVRHRDRKRRRPAVACGHGAGPPHPNSWPAAFPASTPCCSPTPMPTTSPGWTRCVSSTASPANPCQPTVLRPR